MTQEELDKVLYQNITTWETLETILRAHPFLVAHEALRYPILEIGIQNMQRRELRPYLTPRAMEMRMVDMRQTVRHHYGSRDKTAITDCGLHRYPFFARPHIADDKVKVSLFRNHEDAVRDRRTVVNVGKAVKLAQPDWSDNRVRYAAERIAGTYAPLKLKFARTRDEIKWVYTNGDNTTRSCMSNESDSYSTNGVHPAEVYATDNLAVAYAVRDSEVIGRAVVNEKDKTWARFYGKPEFRPLLESAGYTHTTYALVGCKILHLPVDDLDTFVLPYIDASTNGTSAYHQLGVYAPDDRDDSFLVIASEDLSVKACHKQGVAVYNYSTRERVLASELVICEACANEVDREDTYDTADGLVCGDCYAEHYTEAVESITPFRTDRLHYDDCTYCETDATYYSDDLIATSHKLQIVRNYGLARVDRDDNVVWIDSADTWVLRDDCVTCLDDTMELETHAVALDYPSGAYMDRHARAGHEYEVIADLLIGFSHEEIDRDEKIRIMREAVEILNIDTDAVRDWCARTGFCTADEMGAATAETAELGGTGNPALGGDTADDGLLGVHPELAATSAVARVDAICSAA